MPPSQDAASLTQLGVIGVILLVALCASQALGLSQLAFFQAGTGSL